MYENIMEIALVRGRVWPVIRLYDAIFLHDENLQIVTHGLYSQVVRAMFKIKRPRPGWVFPVKLTCNRGVAFAVHQERCISYMKVRNARARATN